jgi:hypothetical protein
MFETVIAMQGENSQQIFMGLGIAGGVLGAFLQPIGRMSRLPYFGYLILLYILAFGGGYVLGLSTNVALIFWGYLILGVSVGALTAWIARARSADIVGDGSYAFLAFIPLAGLYLVFASGKFLGNTVAQSKTTTTKVGLALAGFMGTFGTYGMIESAGQDAPNQFAEQIVSEIVTPSRLDKVTILMKAEAVENRVRLSHIIEGQAEQLPTEFLQGIKSRICANTEMISLYEQMNVEREFLYFDESMNPLGSFVAGCP